MDYTGRSFRTLYNGALVKLLQATLVLCILAPDVLHAQGDAPVRARVVQILAQAGDQPLPSGDTLVQFANQGPILYFTVRQRGDTVASSMVRNDGLVGWATSLSTNGRVGAFAARWANPGGVQADVTGQVVRTEIRLRGAKVDRMPAPTIPWAVADYGMDDQLVPLFRSLPRDTSVAIAVWRPFGQKWDTLTVRTRLQDGILIVSELTVTTLVNGAGRLLMIHDSRQNTIRRPLQGSATFAEYSRIVEMR